jgi:hypothetical protein
MTKSEFITLLRQRIKTAGVFGGRFEPYGGSEDHWSYVRPAVDCFEPTINLEKDGVVEYVNYGGKPEIFTYEDFANKYKLI